MTLLPPSLGLRAVRLLVASSVAILEPHDVVEMGRGNFEYNRVFESGDAVFARWAEVNALAWFHLK